MNDQVHTELERVLQGIAAIGLFEDALRAGHRRISAEYPRVRENFVTIGGEIGNTLAVVAMTASVVTHARIAIADDRAAPADAQRIVDLVDQHARLIPPLERQVARVSQSRDVIRQHVEAIEAKTNTATKVFRSFGTLLSISSRRYSEDDVADAMTDIYVTTTFYDDVSRLGRIVERALGDVRSTAEAALASGDTTTAEQLLTSWDVAFADIESRANFAALGLDALVSELV
jgi:hypothetical protein